METLINTLVLMVLFACLALGMKWICDKFFSEFRPAYWICGVILLIMLLVAFSAVFGGAPLHFPWQKG